ncbi:MAG: glycosyltransferase family 4 protein [bacterium]|nr:glycosyltransferase family 4 protein [bacterium]
MRIAQVAPLYERVPPVLYGGTERVVSYLTEALVRSGHEVTLFASGDSRTGAALWAPCRRALRLDAAYRDPLAPHVRMLGEVYRRAPAFDVIHCHTDYLGLPFTRWVRTPTLVTLHGRLDIPEIWPLYADYPEVGLVSISDAQRRPMPAAAWMGTVHHGLPRRLYAPSLASGSYLVFMGRISPEKRPDAAIAIARRAGVPLKIAAKVDAVDRAYWETEIRPLLDGPLVEFLGEVGDDRKGALLAGAAALLFPIDWPEPFGLVMIEALACGTPVVARRRGSVPEIVEDGVTGFVRETDDELVAAVHRLPALDRARCRAAFETRFTDDIMAQRYLDLFARVRAPAAPSGRRPRAAGRGGATLAPM